MFEMKNWSVLATIYNDKSVLENHHVATLFKIASNREADIFDGLSKDQYKNIWQQVIDYIIATDMSLHFEMLKRFDDKLKAKTA